MRHCSRAARHRAFDVWPLLHVQASALFNSLADQVRGDRSDMLQGQRIMPSVDPPLAGSAASMLAAVIGDVGKVEPPCSVPSTLKPTSYKKHYVNQAWWKTVDKCRFLLPGVESRLGSTQYRHMPRGNAYPDRYVP